MLFLSSHIPFIALQSTAITRSLAVSNFILMSSLNFFLCAVYSLSLPQRTQSNTSGHFAKPPEKVYAFMGIHGGFPLATPSSTSEVVKTTNVNNLNRAIKVLRIHIPFLYFLFLFLAIFKPVTSTSNSAHPQKCQLRQRGLMVPAPLPTSPAGLPTKSPTGSSIGTFNSSWEYFDFSKEKVRGVNL